MCGSSTAYVQGNMIIPKPPKRASRFFLGDRNVRKLFTHLEIRIADLPILEVIQVVGFYAKGLYYIPLHYEGFLNYSIIGIPSNLHKHDNTIAACEQGSNDRINFSKFWIPTGMYTHHEDKHGSRTYPVEKAKAILPTSGCLIFAGRHMPADRLIGNVFPSLLYISQVIRLHFCSKNH